MKVLDPGHKYELVSLDGGEPQVITYVKRMGAKYPGNLSAYGGTTLQEGWRADLNRLRCVNGQAPCYETGAAIQSLRIALYYLECRAARMHGRTPPTMDAAEFGDTCGTCGHVGCEGHTAALEGAKA